MRRCVPPTRTARIAQAFQTMMDAHGKDDPTGEAADAAFHLSIAEASHTWCCCR